jgi:hypothetical protein
MRFRELTDGGQFLNTGAGGISVQYPDADTSLVQPPCQPIENASNLCLTGHIRHPTAITHGTAKRLQ